MEVVTGFLQAYPWGREDGLASWCGQSGSPQAELWFGTHPHGPSPRRDGDGQATGTDFLLTKLLAPARALSLQVHPAADLAAQMFQEQSEDPTAPELLSDPYAKVEMLVALEPFSVLADFRDPRVAAQVLTVVPAAAAAVDQLRAGEITAAIRTLLTISAADIEPVRARVLTAMADVGLSAFDIAALQTVFDDYPGDAGGLVAVLLDHRILQPGEALYVPAGVLHAYVNGVGLEVMTSSDNVLRLGLTGKTIAVDEALSALALDERAQVVAATGAAGGRQTFAPADAPFLVDLIDDAAITAGSGVSRTVLCLSGRTTVHVAGRETSLGPGEALLASATDPAIAVLASARAAVVQQSRRNTTTGGVLTHEY